MHPIFRRKAALLAYLAAWIPVALQTATTLGTGGHLNELEVTAITILLTVSMAAVCLTPWYLCRLWPLRSTSPAKLITGFLISAMLVNALVIGAVRLALYAGSAVFSPTLPLRLRAEGGALASIVFFVYLLAVAMHYMMLSVEQSKRAELLSREAELKALKAQINPHFLFNSLNSISALALKEPASAREMCIKLADFFRISLRLGERMVIPLSEEWALARKYLDVEQVRFGQRLRVEESLDASCKEYPVPPLLVQPLVENAIKHGIATLAEGGEVGVRTVLRATGIQISVENPFDQDAPQMRGGGVGLLNVRNRLQARYGEAAKMEVEVNGTQYRVTIHLPNQVASGGEG